MKRNESILLEPIRIRQIREYRGMKQVEVAHKLGIAQSSYNDIEHGYIKISVDKLCKLTEILGVSIMCFFEKEIPLDELITLSEKINMLKQHNKELEDLLSEKTRHSEYFGELLADAHKRLKEKRSFISILMLFTLLTVVLLIFTLCNGQVGIP